MIYEVKYNEKAYKNRLNRVLLIFFIIVVGKLSYYSNNFELVTGYFKNDISPYFIVILDLLIWIILISGLWKYIEKQYKNSTYNFTGEYKNYTQCNLKFEENYIVIYSKNISNKIYFKDILLVDLKKRVIMIKTKEFRIAIDAISYNEEIYMKLVNLK